MALPTLDATFASSADLPRKQMLAKWIIGELGSGSIADYWSLPERYLWAKIAVAAGGPKTEATYISLPKNYVWSDIYNAISGSSEPHTDWTENVALGHIAAAYRGDTGNPANLATYIDWPWRYKVASIIDSISACSDNQANLLIDGKVLVKSAGTEPRFSYNLGSFTVSWSGGLWVYDDTSIPITLGTATSEELYPWLAGLGSKICP